MEHTQDTIALIALSWLYKNRLRKARNLLEFYGSAGEVWKHLSEDGMSEAWQKAEKELLFINRHNISVFTSEDDGYPYRLRQCPDAPLLLYGKGRCEANSGKMVSVVGTRDCTDRGRELTRQVVLDLAAMLPDVTIISGLAYGIDIAAHKAALEADIPTLVITGHGMDRIYPIYHRDVAVKALERGGIFTEYMTGTEPDRQNFVARDRIIAGMADAVVIVESKEKGGALITARMAHDYSRSLFAFPGRVSDVASRGCNALIRDQKAALVESAEDIVKAMMWDADAVSQPLQTEIADLFSDLTTAERLLLDKLREQEDGIHINFLQAESGMSYQDTASTLTMMEMKGLVRSLPGGIFRALR